MKEIFRRNVGNEWKMYEISDEEIENVFQYVLLANKKLLDFLKKNYKDLDNKEILAVYSTVCRRIYDEKGQYLDRVIEKFDENEKKELFRKNVTGVWKTYSLSSEKCKEIKMEVIKYNIELLRDIKTRFIDLNTDERISLFWTLCKKIFDEKNQHLERMVVEEISKND